MKGIEELKVKRNKKNSSRSLKELINLSNLKILNYCKAMEEEMNSLENNQLKYKTLYDDFNNDLVSKQITKLNKVIEIIEEEPKEIGFHTLMNK